MNRLKSLLLLLLVSVIMASATPRKDNFVKQVFFTMHIKHVSGTHGKYHRSPVSPITGVFCGDKLIFENSGGAVLEILEYNEAMFSTIVPTNGEVEIPDIGFEGRMLTLRIIRNGTEYETQLVFD